MKELRIKDICTKESSCLKQKDLPSMGGEYPVYGASGLIGHINTFHQGKEYIAIVKDGSGIGRVMFLPPKSSVIGTMQYILPKPGYDINYIGYCLRSLALDSYKQGAAIPHIYFRDYGERIVRIEEDLSKQKEIVKQIEIAFEKIDITKQDSFDSINETMSLYDAVLRSKFSPQPHWQEKSISSLGETRVGPFGSALHKNDYIDGGIPIINPMHIRNGKVYANPAYSVSSQKRDELSSYIMKEGDIIIGRRGEMGRCAVITKEEEGYLCGTGSIFFRPNPKEVNSVFLTALLCSVESKKKLESLAGGATMMNLSSKAFGTLRIILPTKSEQDQIIESILQLAAKILTLKELNGIIYKECDSLKDSILKQIFN